MIRLDQLKKLLSESKQGIFLICFAALMIFTIIQAPNFYGVAARITGLLKPMFIGLGIAYVLNLPMKQIEKMIKKYAPEDRILYKKSRSVSIFITIILALVILSILLMIIVPQLIQSLMLLVMNIANYVTNLVNMVEDALAYFHIDSDLIAEYLNEIETLPWNDLIDKAMKFLSTSTASFTSTVSGVWSGLMDIIGTLGVAFTGFMISLFLLSGKEQYQRQARKMTIAFFGKEGSNIVFYWASQINKIFSNFIGGQLVEATILFAIYYICMTLLNMPYALLISAIIGVTSIVPVFGAMLGSAIGTFLILAINPWQAVFFYIFYQVLQQIENTLIYPHVVGNSVGLPGVFVMVSIMAFGSLFGFLGMLLAVPSSAVIYQMIKELTNYGIKKRNVVLDDEGFIKKEQ